MVIIQVSLPIEERRDFDKMYNPFNFTQLTVYYGFIIWRDVLRSMMPKELSFNPLEIMVNLDAPKYIQGLEKVLAEAPKRLLSILCIWGIILNVSLTYSLITTFFLWQLDNLFSSQICSSPYSVIYQTMFRYILVYL